MRASRDLDQLREAIADLCYWKGAQEGEIEEGVDRCMICSQAVLVVAVIDSNLDRHRGVNQANDSGWYSDEVGVPAVGGTSEPAGYPLCQYMHQTGETTRRLMGECLDIISGDSELLPSNISHKASSNDQNRFLCRLVSLAAKSNPSGAK